MGSDGTNSAADKATRKIKREAKGQTIPLCTCVDAKQKTFLCNCSSHITNRHKRNDQANDDQPFRTTLPASTSNGSNDPKVIKGMTGCSEMLIRGRRYRVCNRHPTSQDKELYVPEQIDSFNPTSSGDTGQQRPAVANSCDATTISEFLAHPSYQSHNDPKSGKIATSTQASTTQSVQDSKVPSQNQQTELQKSDSNALKQEDNSKKLLLGITLATGNRHDNKQEKDSYLIEMNDEGTKIEFRFALKPPGMESPVKGLFECQTTPVQEPDVDVVDGNGSVRQQQDSKPSEGQSSSSPVEESSTSHQPENSQTGSQQQPNESSEMGSGDNRNRHSSISTHNSSLTEFTDSEISQWSINKNKEGEQSGGKSRRCCVVS